MSRSKPTSTGIVALFSASDDTVDMVQKLLTAAGGTQTLISCHLAALKKGIVDFETYMGKHNPEVVIFDISPPYKENWTFFKTLRDAAVMTQRGMVLTTTNKNRLDEVLGNDSHALEVVGGSKTLSRLTPRSNQCRFEFELAVFQRPVANSEFDETEFSVATPGRSASRDSASRRSALLERSSTRAQSN